MTLREAAKLFATPARIEAVQRLAGGRGAGVCRVSGLAGSAPAMLLSGLKKTIHPFIVVADDADDAGYIYADLCALCGDDAVLILPSGFRRDIRYGQPDAPARILRTEAVNGWDAKATRFLVTYPAAMAERVPAPQTVSDNTLRLATGQKHEMTAVTDRLRNLGFSLVDYVYEPGQYARRGSIIDVYSYAYEQPFRIDFFDDEIDSIRVFDIETQLSQRKLDEVSIMPEIPADSQSSGTSLLEFTGEDAVVFCRSLSRLEADISKICASKLSDAAMISGEADASALDELIDPEPFLESLRKRRVVEFSADADAAANLPLKATVTIECSPQGLYHKNFDLISTSFSRLISQGYSLFIMSDSPRQTERLKTIFNDRGDNIPFTPVEHTLHAGFADNEAKKCFFTDHQIFDRFHKYSLRSEKARSGKLALSLKELSQIETGDYIVHIDHGIGRFGGLVKTSVNGHPQEMIKLVYRNDDIIFVSIHSLHKLSKYRGKEGVPPKIDRLGSGAWNKLKERTKTKVKDIARDLIRLYAARKEQKGFSFSPDSYLQHELEASFIYEDTPDQLKASQAVKADMESDRPMDRLICGDVGFGKTEIAIRAAFKAAADSKQTVVLVPTTVLALQHYQTFSERLKDLPVRVDFLSRARKPKEVKQILADLEEGKIDIIIGTHKILGKNVKFKDLGLLVIDEEQKFGVAVKEKLKQLKVNIDTLTLSATPIPRTLQFSLMGARDLSSLSTPPANRHPIVTNVTVMDDEVIRDAVNFEISRNGQVFFISNNIDSLTMLRNKLERLIPGIRVVVAHGQMPPDQLEQAVIDFANHEYDVLLSTTIVENGIDMPNVNTIIVNNAQNFGLSELHQLRGRVGRSSRKAFCYLIAPPDSLLTPVARRRLQAIESFSDLGAGIHIAMQDLDIRGAGNLLGAEQSGFIADLGYEAYQKILKESVLELKTEEFPDTFADISAGKQQEFTSECVVESDLELLLPATYVPQESERISLYRRLDNMETDEETERFRNDLRDRFGPIPPQTEQLIQIVPLRRIARSLGIERLTLKNGTMFLYFVSGENKAFYESRAFTRMLVFIQTMPKRTDLRDKNNAASIVFRDVPDVATALDLLKAV